MTIRRLFTAVLSLAAAVAAPLLLSSCGGISADEKQPYQSVTARYLPGPEKTVLQTPCYRFTDARGRKVELTGAIHIAEKSYYHDLNRHFGSFDAVLYEGVGSARPHGKAAAAVTQEKKEQGEESNVSKIYRTMAYDYLHLSLQAEEIDYGRANFVHADMTTEEFGETLKKHHLTMDSMIKTGPFSPGLATSRWLLGVMKYLMPKDDPEAMKRTMAPSLARADEDPLSPAAYQVIIVERDRHLLEVMDRELKAGKRNLSIFYGSGHFPDLQQQLKARGWRSAGVEWRDAWVITNRKN